MKDKNGRVIPYKLIPGGLTVGSPGKRKMMLDSSASNLQDPSSMVDLGYVHNIPKISDDQLSYCHDHYNKTSKKRGHSEATKVFDEKRRELKESSTKLKKENDKLRKELNYKDSQKELFKNIVDKAEQYISQKLNEQDIKEIKNNEENLELNEQNNEINPDELEQIDDDELLKYADIKTTSSMRERVKGLETKERIKLLMKRSMSNKEMKKVKQSLDDRIDEDFQSPIKTVESSPQKSIKGQLDRLNSMNNPLSKHIDDDAISVKSKMSNKVDRERNDNKRSNMVKLLQDEVNKEKNAKNNALNILKNLKSKSKEVDNVIQLLSK
eukprot:Mrub_05182.p1 GENE.Mrub_05182~~Mrub_05182.p1  ORF type:complete len:352 (+),score=88.46 Mrub_05182:82-1056(+)